MAGLDDYQYFTRLQDEDNPFWERANTDDTDGLLKTSPSAQMLFQRPNDFPQKLQSSQRLHQGRYLPFLAQKSISYYAFSLV